MGPRSSRRSYNSIPPVCCKQENTFTSQAAEFPSPNVHTVKDVHAETFITAYAAFLSKSGKVNAPANVDIIKTGRTFICNCSHLYLRHQLLL